MELLDELRSAGAFGAKKMYKYQRAPAEK